MSNDEYNIFPPLKNGPSSLFRKFLNTNFLPASITSPSNAAPEQSPTITPNREPRNFEFIFSLDEQLIKCKQHGLFTFQLPRTKCQTFELKPLEFLKYKCFSFSFETKSPAIVNLRNMQEF